MLQFIFGRAASGKSTLMYERLRECVDSGRKTVFIVPEQFSFETEKNVLRLLGDKNAASVSVMSFNRLCDEVERTVGGMCGRQLTDASKLILLNRAMRDCAPQLSYWKKYIRYQGFACSMLDSIEEFKLNFVMPQDLLVAADKTDNPSLAAKLRDISLIYDMYNAIIEERFIDPSDRLTKLYYQLEKFEYFKEKTVFIDTFKSFTGQQHKIIDRIFASAENVYIALTNDTTEFKRYDIFENIRKTVETLKKRALAHNVRIADDINLKNEYYVNKGLAAVEEILFKGKTDIEVDDNSVTIVSANGIYDEAEFAARTIRRLVRTENYRYKDFVIIARDATVYEESVASACEKNDVSCFIDKRMPLLDFPTAGAVLAAFEAIQSYSTESIMRFHKSGLGLFTTEELSMLENYTRLWNINGKKWLVDWNMNPDGLVSGSSKDMTTRLDAINTLRRRAIKPIELFRNSFSGNAAQRVTAIIELLDECKASDSFKKMSEDFCQEGMLARSDALRQSWDMMMEIFDSMVDCYADASLEDDEFINSFKMATGLASIGVAPQMLDEVSFGSADRIRPSRPKVAFILGANQGVFPAVIGSNGLFGSNDRTKLIALDIPIPDRNISSAIDEDFLVYSNLCCATERLYICHSVLDSGNKESGPSEFVERLASGMNCARRFEPSDDADSIPETAAAAFSAGCMNIKKDKTIADTYFSAVEEIERFSGRSEKIFSANRADRHQLSKETAKKLYGSEIRISASKLDVFHRCRFSYFCKYGLGTSKLQPADFDVLQRGTLIHFVLQCLFEEHMDRLFLLTDEEIFAAVDRYIEEYLESIPGYSGAHNPHLNFLLENMARSLKEVALQLRDEFAQSDFVPVHCEFKFGLEDKPPIFVDFEDGRIALNGSIDRVDSWNGYLRIVDYKSGVKNFHISDILVGQNMQMLLYLYAITRHDEYSDMRSAGIFYMPSKRNKKDDKLAMNGLLVGDKALIEAMDKENNGRFIPCYKLTSSGALHKNYASSFVNDGDFETIFKFIEGKLKNTGRTLLAGDISVSPMDGVEAKACEYCEFSAICGIEDSERPKAQKLTTAEVMDSIREEVEDDGV